MRIRRVVIKDFRKFESLEVDFCDSLERVRDLSLLVGPNTSGKTTFLDAIAAALSPLTRIRCLRSSLRLTVPGIVRRGALKTRVEIEVQFDAEEIDTACELWRLAGHSPLAPLPDGRVTAVWQYPDPMDKVATGRTHCIPSRADGYFQARSLVARLLVAGKVDTTWFRRAGAVFTFDQERTGMGKTIRKDIFRILQSGGVSDEGGDDPEERYTEDPHTILLAMAVESQYPRLGGETDDKFQAVKESYARVCAPHRIVGPVRTPPLDGLEVWFHDGHGDYPYSAASSGEKMLLTYLIRMVSEHMHRSVLLVDELELHQHPTWQQKLAHVLPRIGIGNQVLATTHSPYLRDCVAPEAVTSFGDLAPSLQPKGAQ